MGSMKAPTTLYHYTPTESRAFILEHGLVCRAGEFYSPDKPDVGAINFTTEKPVAIAPGVDAWEVDVQGLPVHKGETNGHRYHWYALLGQNVSPERLTLLN